MPSEQEVYAKSAEQLKHAVEGIQGTLTTLRKQVDANRKDFDEYRAVRSQQIEDERRSLANIMTWVRWGGSLTAAGLVAALSFIGGVVWLDVKDTNRNSTVIDVHDKRLTTVEARQASFISDIREGIAAIQADMREGVAGLRSDVRGVDGRVARIEAQQDAQNAALRELKETR